jgi:outer membrane protein
MHVISSCSFFSARRALAGALAAIAIAAACPVEASRANASGAPSDAVRGLTLDECIALARQSSLGLRVAENALSSARLERKAQVATSYPQVHFGGAARTDPTFGRYGYDPIITDFGEIDAQIVAEQMLYGGGIFHLQLKQTKLDIENLGIARKITERDVVFDVTQSFVEVLRAREEVALDRESLAQLDDYLSVVQDLYRSGRVGYTDVLKTRIQLAAARTSLQSAIETFALARLELSQIVRGTADTTLVIAGSLDSMEVARLDTAGSFGKSLESQSNAIGIERTSLDVELARHARYPTLSVFADAGLVTSLDPVNNLGRRFEYLGYSAGVSLQVPLLDWGQAKYRADAQRFAFENARYEAELFNRSQAREVRSISLQISNLERRAGTLRRTTKDADDNYLLTKSKYMHGAALALEVLDAQQLVTDARLGELQARADALKLSARLEQILTR